MKRFLNRATIIPAVLAVYLAVMVVLGWPNYKDGTVSALLYFGGTVLCGLCICLLRRNLLAARRRHRERDRRG